MQTYKTLFVISILGGIMLLLANTMVTADRYRRPLPSALPTSSVATEPARLAVRTSGPAGASGHPALESQVGRIRALLAAPERGGSAFENSARQELARALEQVRESDWPLIQQELQRPNAPDGYRAMLLLLAGATRSPRALPALAGAYAASRSKVVEALALNGTPEALDLMCVLYDKTTSFEEKFAMIRAAPRFGAPAAARLSGWLDAEKDEQAILELVTVLRCWPEPAVLERLVAFVRSPGRSGDEAVRRAMNSISGMKLEEGGAALLALAAEDELAPASRAAAAEAFSWLRDHRHVAAVLARLREAPAGDPALVRYLERNACPADGALIQETAAAAACPEVRAALELVAAALVR